MKFPNNTICIKFSGENINWPNPLCNKLSVYTGEATERVVTATAGTSGTIITSSGSNPNVWRD